MSHPADASKEQVRLSPLPTPTPSNCLVSVQDDAVRRILAATKRADDGSRRRDDIIELEIRACVEDILEAYEQHSAAKCEQEIASQKARHVRGERVRKQRAALRSRMADRENVPVTELVCESGLFGGSLAKSGELTASVAGSRQPLQERQQPLVQTDLAAVDCKSMGGSTYADIVTDRSLHLRVHEGHVVNEQASQMAPIFSDTKSFEDALAVTTFWREPIKNVLAYKSMGILSKFACKT